MTKFEGNAWRWRYCKEWLPDHFHHSIAILDDVLCQITTKPVTREHVIMLGNQTPEYGDDWISLALHLDFVFGAIP